MSNKERKERKRNGSKFVHSKKIKNSEYSKTKPVGYITPFEESYLMDKVFEVAATLPSPWSSGPRGY